MHAHTHTHRPGDSNTPPRAATRGYSSTCRPVLDTAPCVSCDTEEERHESATHDKLHSRGAHGSDERGIPECTPAPARTMVPRRSVEC
eukprot:1191783-Prymnesium_polylepis.1